MTAFARVPTHFVHLLLGLGAIVVLLAYVIFDIRKNGWQSFVRRIRSKAPNEEGSSPTQDLKS